MELIAMEVKPSGHTI